jgi:hypothetical protein
VQRLIQIPIEEVIYKIKEKAGISEDDINVRIEDKLTQLSGLISRNGAAHIIANELNVNLFESMTGEMQIKKLLAGMRNIETKGRVQRVFEVKEFQSQTRSGKVGSFVLGDETGTIRIVLWNDQADLLAKLKENDIVKLKDGYVRENSGRKEVHLNDRSTIEINPEGVEVGEVKQFSSTRKKITELDSEQNDVELLGTIVQVFDLRFFEVCPQCNKRARQHQDGFMCEEHQKVTPEYSYVMNVVLDDGSAPNGTIRIVLFRNQVERLLQKNHEEILVYKEEQTNFDSVKNELLGTIVKLVGRVTKNQMMDRLEFVSQLVFVNPDPEEEIKRLSEEVDTQ